MSKRVFTIPAVVLSLAVAGLVFAVADNADAVSGVETTARGTVVAVIPRDSPPTYYRDEKTGKPAGFAVDVMNAIAERSGLRIDYVFEDGWSDIIEMVKSGDADLAPGMGVSKDREKDLAFSELIDTFPIAFFVRSEHGGIDGSPGIHAVGVIRGSVAFERLKDRADLRLILYDSFGQGLFDLLAGKIESFACPAPTLWQLARETGVEDHIKVVDKPIAEIRRAIAVRKDDRMLLDRLNRAIETFIGTPAYQQVYVKWYGKPVPYWTERGIILSGSTLLLVIIAVMAGWRYLSVVRLNRELSIAVAKRDEAVSSAEQNSRRLESLVRISQHRTENTQELLDRALEEAIQLTGSRIGYIYFYSEERKEFTLNTWSREVMRECAIAEPQTIYRLEKTGIWGEAVRQRKPIILQEYHAPHPHKKGYPPGHVRLDNFLTVPVTQGERIVAVVGVANKSGIYDEGDIRQLTLLMDAVWRMAELKQIETALRASEATTRSFLNAVKESAMLLDRNGTLLAANETLAQRLGVNAPEIIGTCLYDSLPPDVAARRRAYHDEVFASGKPVRFEDERASMIIDNSVYPVFDQGGKVEAVAVIGIDITERRRAAAALEVSEAKYRTLFDSARDGIFIVGMDGKLLDINQIAHDRLGYTRDEMLAIDISRLDAPDYAGHVRERMGQLMRLGQLIFESAHVRKDGSIMPVEINSRTIDYDGGKVFFSIVRDITERKSAEQEREKLIDELQKALTEIKTLHGILPICSSCKKVRDDSGAWHQLEAYIRDHTDAEFSHGLCMDCARKLYPDIAGRIG